MPVANEQLGAMHLCSENSVNSCNMRAMISGSLVLYDVVHDLSTFRSAAVGLRSDRALVLDAFARLTTLPLTGMELAGDTGVPGRTVAIGCEPVRLTTWLMWEALDGDDVVMPPVTLEMTNIGASVAAGVGGDGGFGCGVGDRISCLDVSIIMCADFKCCSSLLSVKLTLLYI